jgi:hypothetical protein
MEGWACARGDMQAHGRFCVGATSFCPKVIHNWRVLWYSMPSTNRRELLFKSCTANLQYRRAKKRVRRDTTTAIYMFGPTCLQGCPGHVDRHSLVSVEPGTRCNSPMPQFCTVRARGGYARMHLKTNPWHTCTSPHGSGWIIMPPHTQR